MVLQARHTDDAMLEHERQCFVAAAGLASAIVIGAVAGLYPATRAARLAPTEALRAAVAERPAPPAAEPSRFDIYAPVKLTADLGHLGDAQKSMIGLLIEASKIMDELFWYEAYGEKEEFVHDLSYINEDGDHLLVVG